jgi:hypothetical protein
MCAPTYEEFEKMIYKEDNALVMKKAKIAELKKAVDNPALNMFQRAEFQAELNTLDYFVGILLPSDTMDALTRIALGQDVTDIKKVTKDILTQAAVKSELTSCGTRLVPQEVLQNAPHFAFFRGSSCKTEVLQELYCTKKRRMSLSAGCSPTVTRRRLTRTAGISWTL